MAYVIRRRTYQGGNTINPNSGIPEGGHIVRKSKDIDIISRFEKVLMKHFGPTGVYILNVQISNLGRTKDTLRPEDMERLIQDLKEEFIKVIRYDVDLLEKELRDAMKNN